MCVIICKPKGVEMPSADILQAAYKANPHGCGIVSPSVFYKGLSFNSFLKAARKVRAEEPCIIHFRLATHGSVKRSNCHPFQRGEVYFAHNGILNIQPKGDMTDSETAFQNILYPAMCRYGWGSMGVFNAVHKIIGSSKFAFLWRDRLHTYGNFIKREDGCLYSNLRFIPYLDGRTRYRKHAAADGTMITTMTW